MGSNELENPFHFYLWSAALKLGSYEDERVTAYGVTRQAARVVGFIGEQQRKGITLNQKGIEEKFQNSGASVSSLLKGLERKGFIKRKRSAGDDRVKEITLTVKGRELIEVMNSFFSEAEDRIVQGMTDEQKETLLKLLQIVNKNLES